jgi:uncharacterized protein (DUF58 family)
MCSAGGWLGHDVTRIVGGALLGFVAVAVASVLRSGRVVAMAVLPTSRVERGAVVELGLDFENRAATASLPATATPTLALAPVNVPGLGPGERSSLTYTMLAARRGRLDLGDVAVDVNDMFGLARRGWGSSERASVLVFPVVRRVDAPRLAGSGTGSAFAPVRNVAGSDVFGGLRDYVLGDNVRSIHARTSVRVGRLVCRQDLDAGAKHVDVLLDVRAEVPDAPFEECVDIAASVVDSLLAAGLPVTLHTSPGRALRLTATPVGRDVAVRFLAEVQRAAASDGSLAPLGRAIVVTGLLDRQWRPAPRVCIEVGAGVPAGSGNTIRVPSAAAFAVLASA